MTLEGLSDDCGHIDIPLTNVVSFAACALDSPRAPAPRDPLAAALWARLGADVARLSPIELDAARERARVVDDVTRRWSNRHPDGTVVELGAGLSTRHARLAELAMTFVAVDEPPLAALRRDLFAAPAPFVQVAMPLEDRRWCRAVVAASREVLVLVPDAFVDMAAEDVVASFVALAAELPCGAEVVATYGPRTQLRVAKDDARNASLALRVDRGFGAVDTVWIPRLRWVHRPRADDGDDVPALAHLVVT